MASDDVVPVQYSRDFAATHTNAQLEEMDSDHQLLDVLEPMVAQVKSFLL